MNTNWSMPRAATRTAEFMREQIEPRTQLILNLKFMPAVVEAFTSSTVTRALRYFGLLAPRWCDARWRLGQHDTLSDSKPLQVRLGSNCLFIARCTSNTVEQRQPFLRTVSSNLGQVSSGFRGSNMNTAEKTPAAILFDVAMSKSGEC